MNPSHSTRKRRGESWSEDTMKAAIKAVQRGHLTQRLAAARYNIPRRTLRDHLKTGQEIKRLGRKPILTNTQEKDLASRIKRFASIGIPLTPKFIRKQAFLFCERYDIKNNFNKSKRIAGVDWLRYFLKRNPSISKRKPQIMNPARAQKLNKPIVQQHFQSIRKLYDELDILRHPERLYNMDEKGCRITVHKQHTVLAEKGSRRVHLIAPEHAENVTIAMCVNAIGTTIPAMILFKGQRQRPDLTENLPAGTLVRMAPKGSMTSDLFVEFIQHLARYKVVDKCLLIFDGAKCHLSVEALDEAEKNDIVLYCLPSNTTHELQPLDKSVNKSFEHHWDEAVLNYMSVSAVRTLNKADFNKIFSQVWPKCMTHSNIVNGFKATGLYPYNPEAIPEEAFAPSVLSEIPYPQNQNQPVQNAKSDANVDTDSDENQHNLDVNTSNIRDLTPDEFSNDTDDNLTMMPRNEQCDNVHNFLHEPTPLTAQNISRIVDYSSSTDVSENEFENPTPHDSFRNLCVSPSIIPESLSKLLEAPANEESSTSNNIDMAVPSCSGVQRPIRRTYSSDSSDIDSLMFLPSHDKVKYSIENIYGFSSDEENEILSIINKEITTPKKQIFNLAQENIIQKANSDDDKSCLSDEDVPLSNLKKKTEFEDFLPTPNYALSKINRPRKKAINYKGQRVTKDLFDKKEEDKKETKNANTKENEKKKKDKTKLKNKAIKTKNKFPKHVKNIVNEQGNKKTINEKKDDIEELWYCNACHENIKLDMRQCKFCKKWYHEECVGLTKRDKDFICSNCE
uniref:HTH CENPB-type domain-containing protein n=2 Tax=Heliothis virescens TaxID=7102 RepID=A0A2A4K7W9_HELVI